MAYKAVYKMETSPGLTSDSSGNGYTLTNVNTVVQSAGRRGYAADTGTGNTNKCMYVNSAMGLNSLSAKTQGFWAKLNEECTDGGYLNFLDQQYSADMAGWGAVYHYSSGDTLNWHLLGGRRRTGIGNTEYNVAISASFVGKYTQLIYTYAGGAGVQSLYKNGDLVGTLTPTDTGAGNHSAVNVTTIGQFSNGNTPPNGGQYPSAKIDWVFIDDTVWNAQKIKTLYAAQSGRLQC